MPIGKKKYTITELMSDERFQNYCLKKNKVDEEYWTDIILQNWDQKKLFEQAYSAIHSLSDEEVYTSRHKEGKIIRIKERNQQSKYKSSILMAASCAAIFILLYVFTNLPEGPKYRKVTSNFGEIRNVMLPDSSLVTLNSNSVLVFEESMQKSREVQLIGEGYFDVRTNPDLDPFVVNTQHGNIKVTGTIFNVRSRKELFESTLLEGGITFSREGKNDVILSPGDHLKISNNSIQIKSEEVASKIAWREGRLFFKSVSIKEIIKRLQDDYGLKVSVENKDLANKKISANIITQDPIVLLESIAAIYDFSIVRLTKDKVILK